jgi:hypothetical protein
LEQTTFISQPAEHKEQAKGSTLLLLVAGWQVSHHLSSSAAPAGPQGAARAGFDNWVLRKLRSVAILNHFN